MKRLYKRGIIPMALGVLLVLAAAALTGYNMYTDRRAKQLSAAALQQFNSVYERKSPLEELPYYKLDPYIEMPTVLIDGNEYIGLLEIPDLGLNLSVMSELTEPGLKIAPCRYKGSAYLNNMIIAGHNYRAHFSGIKNIKLDSAVKFTDTDGNIFNYKVSDIQLIDGTAIEDMEAGEWDLTLFTCNYGGRARVTVRCRLTDG